MPTQIAFTVLATVPGGVVPAVIPALSTCETISASATNQQSTGAAASGQTICRVASDVAVYVEFGPNPDATNNTGGRFLVLAGGTEYFSVNTGDKAAVVTI